MSAPLAAATAVKVRDGLNCYRSDVGADLLVGITFNTISAHCLICAKSMCIPCNARHHTHHKEYVSQIENIRWQAKRRDFNEDQQCLCCWSSRRCRLACRKCSFAVCEACLNEESGQILHLQEHHKRHPDHCSFLRVRSPNWSLNTASLEPCECLSDTSSVDHCNRCSCEIYLDEASFCCRTCRLESGTKAKFCPSCIDDADVMDHKRSHEFQTIYYKKMKDAPAYEAPEYIDRLECLQCGESESIFSILLSHTCHRLLGPQKVSTAMSQATNHTTTSML